MDQQELELQLKVWKELAISKQVLLRTVTDALKLDPTCPQDQLKDAVEGFLRKIAKADVDVASAQKEAKAAISGMEKTLAASEKARTVAEATVAELQAAQERTTQQMAAERAGLATEMQKLKDRANEKDKALKAVNTALADTPENVLKKMNVLKKQKQEEADARRQVEASFNTLRKEKQQQDQKMTAVQDNSARLVTQHRDLHSVSLKLHEQLTGLAKDAKDLPAVPELDAKLLEAIEQPDARPESKAKDSKSNGKPKK